MSETNNRTGIFVGLNKCHIVQRPAAFIAKMAWKTRPVTKKGKASKRSLAVREIIREVAGFSPLEKKMLELIRTGVAAKEKKAVKHARAKLGTHRRATLRRDAINNIILAQKRKN